MKRVAPLERGDVRLVALSPDGGRLAYAVVRGIEADVVVASVGANDRKVVATWPYPPRQLSWSPDGQRLAFLAGGPAPHVLGDRVGWCAVGGDGAVRHRPGHAMTWLDDERLLVADGDEGVLVTIDGDGDETTVALPEHEDFPRPLPWLARSAERIGYVARSPEQGLAALFSIDDLDRGTSTVVTEMPTARIAASPFFSPKGALGVHLVHPKGSAMVLFDDPEGTVLYESRYKDHAAAPVWTEAGIVWLPRGERTASGAWGRPELSLLDPGTREVVPLTALVGQPRLGAGGDLYIDAETAAFVVEASELEQA